MYLLGGRSRQRKYRTNAYKICLNPYGGVCLAGGSGVKTNLIVLTDIPVRKKKFQDACHGIGTNHV